MDRFKHFTWSLLKIRQILRWEMWHNRAILCMPLFCKCIMLYFSTLMSPSNLNTGFFQVMEVCRRLKVCSAGVMCCPMVSWGRL